MQTNANSSLLAAIFKTAKHGSFTGLITRKQGVVRGRGADKKTYGDDLVHTVFVTGFNYPRLVERSKAILAGLKTEDLFAKAQTKNLVDGNGCPVTLQDFIDARAELETSFDASIDGTNESSTDHVYESLTVDGESIPGGRVYKCVADQGIKCHCRKCTGDEKAPVNGTIYVQGLQIWSKVLDAAPNGPAPATKSAAKTVAKNFIRKQLPVSRYISYRLEPGTDFILRAGGTAEVEATNNGFKVTDEIVSVIERAA